MRPESFYEMGANPNSIYIPVDKASSGMLIIVLFCAFLMGAIILVCKVAARTGGRDAENYQTEEEQAKTGIMKKSIFVCLAGMVVMLLFYAFNPLYRVEQQNAADEAIQDIENSYGLKAKWEYVPYRIFGTSKSEKRVGRLYIVDGSGKRYPLKLTPATFERRDSDGNREVSESSETFIGEVKAGRNYVPISEFGQSEQ